MCEKKRYCSREIDPCIQEEVNLINNKLKEINYGKTIMCCCGHEKYHKTILILTPLINDKGKIINQVYDNVSHIILSRHRNRTYYKKDKAGYYYIPAVENYYKTRESPLGFYHLIDNIEAELYAYRSAKT